MDDTTLEMAEMIRMKTPSERFNMGSAMTAAFRQSIIRAIIEKNPTISKAALRQELFLELYGNDYTAAEKEKILKHLAHVTKD